MKNKTKGFTTFVRRLDGKPEPKNTSRFHLPRVFYPNIIREGLINLETTGNTGWLMYAFNWGSSPQGHRYWDDIYEGYTVIDKKGMDFLYWLKEQEA